MSILKKEENKSPIKKVYILKRQITVFFPGNFIPENREIKPQTLHNSQGKQKEYRF